MKNKGIVFAVLAIACSVASWAYGYTPAPDQLGLVAAIGAACTLDVVCVAPLQGWRQSSGAAGFALVEHTFSAAPDGQLLHLTDGQLRATVPPEGWAGYLKQWPEAESVVRSLTRPRLPAPIDPPAPAAEKAIDLEPADSAPGIVAAGVEGQESISDQPKDAPQGGGIVARAFQRLAGG